VCVANSMQEPSCITENGLLKGCIVGEGGFRKLYLDNVSNSWNRCCINKTNVRSYNCRVLISQTEAAGFVDYFYSPKYTTCDSKSSYTSEARRLPRPRNTRTAEKKFRLHITT